jgi:hypothetical protein
VKVVNDGKRKNFGGEVSLDQVASGRARGQVVGKVG